MKEDISLSTAAHLKDLEKHLRTLLEEGKREALVVVQTWGTTSQCIQVRVGKDLD